MIWRLVVLSVFIPAVSFACGFAGELGPGGYPITVDCPADIQDYMNFDHRCRITAPQPPQCDSLTNRREAIYKKYRDQPDVAQAIGIWRASSLTRKTAPYKP